MIELIPLGQITTPPPMFPFVERLKRNYDRTVRTLMKATPRALDSMLRSANQILSNEANLQARARSVRELRNLPAREQTAALQGYYEAIKRAIWVIKSGEPGYAQPAQLPTTPQTRPAYTPEPMPTPPVFQPPTPPPALTMPSTPDLMPPPRYVSPVEPAAPPPRFEPPPEPPAFIMPSLPEIMPPTAPVSVPPPVAAIQLLPLPRTPYSEKFKQILSDAISAAFRSLNLTAPAQSPGMTLSPTRYSHIVNVTYEVANKVGRTVGYTYTKRLIQDALQWRYITQTGTRAQLPGRGATSPYTPSAAVIAPVPITPPTIQPVISPEPVFPVTVPGLIPVDAPGKIMDARFLTILNKWMDHFIKSQNAKVRPIYVWYIPRHIMERFVKEIMDASNREGNKYGYTYNKGLVWDALQQRGYEPSTKADGTKRTPYDKKVQPSPYDRPGSRVPYVIAPTPTPPTEIPDIPVPSPVPTPPTDREETYSERMKRKLREAKASREAIEKERKRAWEEKKAKRKEELERKKQARKARQTDILPPLTYTQRVVFLNILNKAINNRLQVAEWPILPGKIIGIPDADYEKLIASIQTFANMMARTVRGVYYSFNSAEVENALASRGYVRGDNTRPAHGPGAAPLSSRVIAFEDYRELLEAIKRKLRDTSLRCLVMTPSLNKPLPIRYIKPAPGETKGCFDIMQRAIRQILVRRRWEVRPALEKIISPAVHAGFVHQVREYANSQYGVKSRACPPFTESYTRDAVILAGYLPHPEGTNVPTTPMAPAQNARSEEKWKQNKIAIHPWEVYTHFPAHFQRNYSTQPIYPTPEPIYHPPGT